MDIKNMDNSEEKDPKIYEIGYFLVPMIAEDAKMEVVNQEIISLIEKGQGEVLTQSVPVLKPLAYSIRKKIQNSYSVFKDGYFGFVKFKAVPSLVVEMNTILGKSDSIIRFLLVEVKLSKKVVKPSRTLGESANKEDSKDESEAEVVVDEVELDKEINDLLV